MNPRPSNDPDYDAKVETLRAELLAKAEAEVAAEREADARAGKRWVPETGRIVRSSDGAAVYSFPCKRSAWVTTGDVGQPVALFVDGIPYSCTPAPGQKMRSGRGHRGYPLVEERPGTATTGWDAPIEQLSALIRDAVKYGRRGEARRLLGTLVQWELRRRRAKQTPANRAPLRAELAERFGL